METPPIRCKDGGIIGTGFPGSWRHEDHEARDVPSLYTLQLVRDEAVVAPLTEGGVHLVDEGEEVRLGSILLLLLKAEEDLLLLLQVESV